MVHQIFSIYIYVSVILGIFFFMIGKPILNFILFVFSVPFENILLIIPQLSLIKAMAILTFLSFAIHNKDFIRFLVEKLILNKFVLTFFTIFIMASILAFEKGNIPDQLTNWLMWFLILTYVRYVYQKYSHVVNIVEISFVIYGVVILLIIFLLQGVTSQSNRLGLTGFLSPNEIAVTFTSMTIIAISLYVNSKSKFFLLLSIIFGITILLTGNRSIPLGVIIFTIVYLTRFLKIKRIRIIISVTSLIILLVLLPFKRDTFQFNMRTRIIYTFQQLYELILHGETSISDDELTYHTSLYRASRIDSDDRGQMYSEAINIFKRNPIFGAGPGSLMFTRRWKEITGIQKVSHSNVSEILIYYGAVGFLFYMFTVLWCLKYGYKNISEAEGKIFFAVLVIFFIDGFFHGNYIDSVVVLILAMTGFKINLSTNRHEHHTLNETTSFD